MEDRVFQKNQEVQIDASFPAESMYIKRGYRITSYEKIRTENGDFLCYHIMKKRADEKKKMNKKGQFWLRHVDVRML